MGKIYRQAYRKERDETEMQKWNRAKRRQMSKLGIAEQALHDGIDKAWRAGEENAYRLAFSGMILALVQKFDFPHDRLHDLAVETMRNVNGALCPTELIEKVKQLTGFDVDEPLDSFEVNMEVDE